MSVDVVLGPAEVMRDLAVIVVLQLAAFGYGLNTMALARPEALAFEIDRFRVVTAADIEPALLDEAPTGLQTLPWTGPRQIAAIKPTDSAEQMKALDLGLAGCQARATAADEIPGNGRRSGAMVVGHLPLDGFF